MSDLPRQLANLLWAEGSSLIPRELSGAQEGTRTLTIITSTLLYQSDFALLVFHEITQSEAIAGIKNKEFGTNLARVAANRTPPEDAPFGVSFESTTPPA
jgi:hypothetical protein